MLAAEPISKVDAVFGPVAVHRNRKDKFRIIQSAKQLTIGLVRISVIDHELIHPVKILVNQFIPGQMSDLLFKSWEEGCYETLHNYEYPEESRSRIS